MPLSLGPPPTAAESSRTRKETVDAGSTMAEREQFMARRAFRSGSAPPSGGLWRACESDKRAAADAPPNSKRVRFHDEADDGVQPVRVPTPQPPAPDAAPRRFPWVWCALLVLVALLVCGSVAACARRKLRT